MSSLLIRHFTKKLRAAAFTRWAFNYYWFVAFLIVNEESLSISSCSVYFDPVFPYWFHYNCWYLRIKSTTKCSYEVFCAAAISVAVTTFLLFTAPRNTKCPWETGDSKCCDNTLLYKWELHKLSLQDLHTINVLVYTSVANAILGPFQHVLFLSLTQASNTTSNGTKKKANYHDYNSSHNKITTNL